MARAAQRLTALLAGATIVVAAGSAGGEGAPAGTPSGREIMARVEASPRGRDLAAKAVWHLVARGGSERLRRTRFYRVEVPGGGEVRAKWLVVFESPADVKDTALLVWNPRDPARDPSQWIYLAGYRKVRRVASGTRGNPFMGTDFSFEDLTERLADHDDHVLLGQDSVAGVDHYVVESTPRERSPTYGKRVQWIDPRSWTPSRIDFYDREGAASKSLQMRWSRVGEAWVAVAFDMESRRDGHRTRIEVSDIRVDEGLDEQRFAADWLGRGTP